MNLRTRLLIAAVILTVVFLSEQQLRAVWKEWDTGMQVAVPVTPLGNQDNTTTAADNAHSDETKVEPEIEGTGETATGEETKPETNETGDDKSASEESGDSSSEQEATGDDAEATTNDSQGEASSETTAESPETEQEGSSEENAANTDSESVNNHDGQIGPPVDATADHVTGTGSTDLFNPHAYQPSSNTEEEPPEGWVDVDWQDATTPGVGDKVIVMARLIREDVTWVARELPSWQRAIYVVDDPNARLTPPRNKGKESMVYLTYIIDNYPNFPSTVAFLHPHRASWHLDGLVRTNVDSLTWLNISYVQKEGYANLRCTWIPGCPDEIQPFKRHGMLKSQEKYFPGAWTYFFGEDSEVPQTVGVSCCSQFAVSRDQILKRSKEEYVRIRQWLLETEAPDETSGRVLEYMWHIIFGRDNVHCPSQVQCYCDVYNKC